MRPDFTVIFESIPTSPDELFNQILFFTDKKGAILDERYYSIAIKEEDNGIYEFNTGTYFSAVQSKEQILKNIVLNNGGECLFHTKEFTNEYCYLSFLPDPEDFTTLILHISASTSNGRLAEFLFGEHSSITDSINYFLADLADFIGARFFVGASSEGILTRHVKEEDLYKGRKEGFLPYLIAYSDDLDIEKIESIWNTEFEVKIRRQYKKYNIIKMLS